MTALSSDNYSIRSKKLLAWPVIIFLFLAIVHYAFRYILRVSDSGTSPGYSDTPPSLSIIKDVFLSIFILSSFFILIKNRLIRASMFAKKSMTIIILCNIIICFGLLIKFLLGQNIFDMLLSYRYIWLYTWIPIFIYFFNREHLLNSINFLIIILRPTLLIFWLFTVAMYILNGRLPALAYPNNLRFGGILDDPNGYGVLCTLLFAFSLKSRQWLWQIILIIMILSTRSLSAYAILLITVSLLLLPNILRARKSKFIYFSFSLMFLFIFFIYFWFTYGNNISEWWAAKQGSLNEHRNDAPRAWSALNEFTPIELLFGKTGFSENLLLYMLLNFGFTGLLSFIVLAITFVRHAVRSENNLIRKLGAWALAVLLMSWSIPYLQVYPISLLFWACLGIAATADQHSALSTTDSQLSSIDEFRDDYTSRLR